MFKRKNISDFYVHFSIFPIWYRALLYIGYCSLCPHMRIIHAYRSYITATSIFPFQFTDLNQGVQVKMATFVNDAREVVSFICIMLQKGPL